MFIIYSVFVRFRSFSFLVMPAKFGIPLTLLYAFVDAMEYMHTVQLFQCTDEYTRSLQRVCEWTGAVLRASWHQLSAMGWTSSCLSSPSWVQRCQSVLSISRSSSLSRSSVNKQPRIGCTVNWISLLRVFYAPGHLLIQR